VHGIGNSLHRDHRRGEDQEADRQGHVRHIAAAAARREG
jgi:hypothetical protein